MQLIVPSTCITHLFKQGKIQETAIVGTRSYVRMPALADILNRRASEGEISINTQNGSPLFKLPAEIRQDIWRLVVQAEDNPLRPFEVNSNYCRPGQLCFKKIHIALLLTCRQVYLESFDLPLSRNTMTFWCYRGPRGEPAMAKYRGGSEIFFTIERLSLLLNQSDSLSS